MFSRLFPKQIDNSYRGHVLAIWFLGLLALMKFAMGANSMINTHTVATQADGIAIDSFNPQAQQAVLAFFAVWGLGQVLLALQGGVVLIRYRAMIPFMFLILLTEHLGRKALFMLHPIARSGGVEVGAVSIATLINYALLALLVIGFVLSLLNTKDKRA